MRVVVASCWKYRDAWKPFFELFQKFWPDCPYPVEFLSDSGRYNIEPEPVLPEIPHRRVMRPDWCSVLANYLDTPWWNNDEPILLLMEDFFLNAPVQQDLIEHALEQMKRWNAAMVRLYPCPGANAFYDDDKVGFIAPASDYSISCQASIWEPEYLHKIASQCDSPWSFEIKGSKMAHSLDRKLLGWKRESTPYPISYECTAIVKGLWTRSALELCAKHGIEVDTSLRGVA